MASRPKVRLTERQKGQRREARRAGLRAVAYVRHAEAAQREAVAWRALAVRAAVDADVKETMEGQFQRHAGLADAYERNAVAAARIAWRYALAQEEVRS